jgi:hypothetical protein
MFTPDELVDPADNIHPNADYGAAVLGQIAAELLPEARSANAPPIAAAG